MKTVERYSILGSALAAVEDHGTLTPTPDGTYKDHRGDTILRGLYAVALRDIWGGRQIGRRAVKKRFLLKETP